MIETLVWWVSVEAIGLAGLPLALHLFRSLPDRGLVFCRPLGLLITSYILWMGATAGIIGNYRATVVVIVAGFAAVCWWRWGGEARQVWVTHKRMVVITEALFAICLLGWTLIRSFDPVISGTEKPMEFAFINSIFRAEQFPPPDPWLAGYSISYYYFGYVMMAFLLKLSGIPPHLSFSLLSALLFSLTVLGVFSLGYNLAEKIRAMVHGDSENQQTQAPHRSPLISGVLTAGLVAIMGNLEGLLEVLNARRLLSPEVVGGLQIRDFPAPYLSPTWLPSDHWWWWRATRVIGTIDSSSGASQDYTITEFPFFSFLLGDVHPHVLSLPFAVMVLALALQALLSPSRPWWKHKAHTLAIGFCVGALGFLNTWDMPTFLAIYLLAYAASHFLERPLLDLTWLGHVLSLSLALSGLAVLLYFPFYITFASQASGIGLVLVHSNLHHFLIVWAPLLLITGAYLGTQVWLWARSDLGMPVGAMVTDDGVIRPEFEIPPIVIAGIGIVIIWISALLWVAGVPVLAFLLPGLLVALGLAIRWFSVGGYDVSEYNPPLFNNGELDARRIHLFLIVLAGISLALLAFCEVFFLRDLFGNRMNTVFKFYYQTWLLLGVLSGGVLYYLANLRLSSRLGARFLRYAGGFLIVIMIAGASVYSIAALISKSNTFAVTPSLNGMAQFARQYPAEYAAIRWLQQNTTGSPVILEASGGSYSQYGRVSMATGLPTLLGWDFHQRQWRGKAVDGEINIRKSQIESIYRGTGEAAPIIKQYDIAYIFVGGLERDAFFRVDPTAESRLRSLGEVVFQQDGVYIVRVRKQT
jgi:YYY domain-containing protein